MEITSVVVALVAAVSGEREAAAFWPSSIVMAPPAASARALIDRPPRSAERGVLVPDFHDVGVEPFVFEPHEDAVNPVLTAADVTDMANCRFVADPFLYYENGTWYIFFEVCQAQTWLTDIAYATSGDALTWTYEKIVLAEPFVEYSNAGLKEAALRKMAAITKGRYFPLADAHELPAAVGAAINATRYAGAKPQDYEIWDSPFLLLLLFGIMGSEWFIRRRSSLA